MIMEYTFPQRSEEWFTARSGLITASSYPDLMPSPSQRAKWNKTQMGLIYEAVASACTGMRKESYSSAAMDWGTEKEPEAREAFSKAMGVKVRECGFFVNSTVKGAGASPDGIFTYEGIALGENGFFSEEEEYTLEIKCPESKTHAQYLDDPSSLWLKYRWQVIGQSLISGINAGAICSFDPRFPEGKQLVVYIPGDISKDKVQLMARLAEAHGEVQRIMGIQNRVERG
jgi:hypothetical protein